MVDLVLVFVASLISAGSVVYVILRSWAKKECSEPIWHESPGEEKQC